MAKIVDPDKLTISHQNIQISDRREEYIINEKVTKMTPEAVTAYALYSYLRDKWA